ncbi:hypothetical protein ACLOJK_010096 [Asimina triloba]
MREDLMTCHLQAMKLSARCWLVRVRLVASPCRQLGLPASAACSRARIQPAAARQSAIFLPPATASIGQPTFRSPWPIGAKRGRHRLAVMPSNVVDRHASPPTTACIYCNGIDGRMIVRKKDLGVASAHVGTVIGVIGFARKNQGLTMLEARSAIDDDRKLGGRAWPVNGEDAPMYACCCRRYRRTTLMDRSSPYRYRRCGQPGSLGWVLAAVGFVAWRRCPDVTAWSPSFTAGYCRHRRSLACSRHLFARHRRPLITVGDASAAILFEDGGASF